ncbi:MAG: NACHT domain-containing protein [Desulfobacteraceae bacterium]|nr:NACHT domain-containing protein [Desulfobacteraceae bacterium]MBC2720991.1 HEAT repeat domain-containing protein [Desulfobacteraceae bacterium]
MILDTIRENQRLIIKGDPGSGKSILMQWVAYTYAKRLLDSSEINLPTPIYLELKWYNDKLIRLIFTCFRKNGIIEEENVIIDWIKKGGFIFLLDGFDELGNKSNIFLKDIKELVDCSEKNNFVITSREVGTLEELESINFKIKKIKPLTESKIQDILDIHLGNDRGILLFDKIKDNGLLNEVSNPLILWFIALEFLNPKEEDSIRKYLNKGYLFKNVIENNFLKRWEKKKISEVSDVQEYLDEKINSLSKLAFYMIEENLIKIEETKIKEIFETLFMKGRTNYKSYTYVILNQLYSHNILIKSRSEVSFWHKSFRDYFAALELIKLYSNDPNHIDKYISEQWEESLIFFSGLINDPSDFISRLIKPYWRFIFFLGDREKDSFKLLLAAKCIGGSNRVNIQIQQKTIDLLIKIIKKCETKENNIDSIFFPILFEYHNCLRALGETKSEKALEFLIETLENHNCDTNVSNYCGTCRHLIEVLQSVGKTQKVQNSLLKAAFYTKDGVARENAIEIIRDSMSHETAKKLVQILLNKQEKNGIRNQAIHILIGDAWSINFKINKVNRADLKYPEIVIDPLINLALEDECNDVRIRAATALGFYKGKNNDKVLSPLINALHNNKNPDIRYNAAYTLSYIFNEKVFKALIKALDDNDQKVVAFVAYILRAHAKAPQERIEASMKLSKLFYSKNIDIKLNSIVSYGVIYKNPASKELSKLIKLLKDEDISVRSCAAEALGQSKAKYAFKFLRRFIYKEKYEAPWASAIWAILQIDPSFSKIIEENHWEWPYINKLLNNDIKTEERIHAIEILRKIGTKISLPYLKELKETKKFHDKEGNLFYAISDIEERINHNGSIQESDGFSYLHKELAEIEYLTGVKFTSMRLGDIVYSHDEKLTRQDKTIKPDASTTDTLRVAGGAEVDRCIDEKSCSTLL